MSGWRERYIHTGEEPFHVFKRGQGHDNLPNKFLTLKVYIQILAKVLSESRFGMAWAGFQSSYSETFCNMLYALTSWKDWPRLWQAIDVKWQRAVSCYPSFFPEVKSYPAAVTSSTSFDFSEEESDLYGPCVWSEMCPNQVSVTDFWSIWIS